MIERQAGQFLAFTLGTEVFAIDILQVREIIEYGQLTEVPMMPPTIRGVINLRGSVVPVIDLKARFHGQPSTAGKRSCIVIVEYRVSGECHEVGVMVDAVNEVVEIKDGDIEPAPAFGAHIKTDFIFGMAKQNGRFTILLNVDRVLSFEDIALLANVKDADKEAVAA